MDFKQTASRLVEKFYFLRGSNQANTMQILIEETLELAHLDGHLCRDSEIHRSVHECPFKGVK